MNKHDCLLSQVNNYWKLIGFHFFSKLSLFFFNPKGQANKLDMKNKLLNIKINNIIVMWQQLF